MTGEEYEFKGMSLRRVAEEIEREFSELKCSVEKSWSSTDRKITGTCLLDPGKGRDGYRLSVMIAETSCVLFEHDSSETYRTNYDIAYWVRRYRTSQKEKDDS